MLFINEIEGIILEVLHICVIAAGVGMLMAFMINFALDLFKKERA